MSVINQEGARMLALLCPISPYSFCFHSSFEPHASPKSLICHWSFYLSTNSRHESKPTLTPSTPNMEAGMRIGIELELLLQHRTKAKSEFTDLESFADYLVQHFHASRKPHPRIHNDIDGLYDGLEDSTEWSLTDDVTIIGNSEQCRS